jgi:glycosyltransferase involved in cell wall biosynthesis
MIEIQQSDLDLEEKAIVKKAFEAFSRNDFQSACNELLSVYKQDKNPRGLQYSIGLCLHRINKRRQARLFAYKELLDYPDNKSALNLLIKENNLINGKQIQHTFTETKRPDKYPDISLVLIVKNEEKDLPRCLESFKDIVKEIVVVDTGSADKTVEIAKSYGAKVEYFEWTNDFAAARNESLKYATCEWILRTDADEYIEDSEKAKLLHCVNSGLAEVYICPTISSTRRGDEIVENVRLIKNNLGIRYDYPIHETIINSVISKGLTQCVTNIDFRHTGYEVVEAGDMARKIKRNVEVCEKYLKTYPDDYYVRLIRDLLIIDTMDLNVILDDLEKVVQTLPENALSVRYLGLAFIYLISRYMEQKNEVELLNILQDCQIHFNTTHSLMQYVGQVYLYNRGDWKKANKIFVWISKKTSESKILADMLHPDKYNLYENQLLVAETMVLNNEFEKAKKQLLKAKKIEESVKERDFSNSENILASQLIKNTADDLRLLAKEFKGKSEWMKAYKAIIFAVSKSTFSLQDYLELAFCQIQLNNLRFAQLLLDEGRKIDPSAHIIYNFEALISIADKNYEDAIEKSLQAFIKAPGNTAYQNNLEKIAGLMELSPIEAIKKTGLKWMKSKKANDGLMALSIYLKFKPDDQEIAGLVKKFTD